MKKKVFIGFEKNVLSNSFELNGGYKYESTMTAGSSSWNDEDFVCEKGEFDPYSGGMASYDAIDATFTDCMP